MKTFADVLVDLKSVTTAPDLTPAAVKAQTLLDDQVEKTFDDQAEPDGLKWAPHEPRKWHLKDGSVRFSAEPRPSRSTGGMERGAESSIVAGLTSAKGFKSARQQVKHWAYQDRGTRRNGVLIVPPRPFWAASEKTLDEVTEFAADLVTKLVEQTTEGGA